MSRSLETITNEITDNWKGWFNKPAAPYLRAMRELNKITDNYGSETAREIVLRFLCNATHWRGDIARRVKAELNLMLVESEPG